MKKIVSLLLATVILSSCGTVFSGFSQEMAFDSNQPDVKIYMNGEFLCETPCVVDVDRKRKEIKLHAKKDGYPTKDLMVSSRLNVVSFFNVISSAFGLFGTSTDYSSDGMWEYQKDSFYVNMRQEPKTEQEKKLYAKEDKIREFVLKNYPQIQVEFFYENETAKEYILSLQSLTGLSFVEIRNVLANSNNEAECAERMVNEYYKATERKPTTAN